MYLPRPELSRQVLVIQIKMYKMNALIFVTIKMYVNIKTFLRLVKNSKTLIIFTVVVVTPFILLLSWQVHHFSETVVRISPFCHPLHNSILSQNSSIYWDTAFNQSHSSFCTITCATRFNSLTLLFIRYYLLVAVFVSCL